MGQTTGICLLTASADVRPSDIPRAPFLISMAPARSPAPLFFSISGAEKGLFRGLASGLLAGALGLFAAQSLPRPAASAVAAPGSGFVPGGCGSAPVGCGFTPLESGSAPLASGLAPLWSGREPLWSGLEPLGSGPLALVSGTEPLAGGSAPLLGEFSWLFRTFRRLCGSRRAYASTGGRPARLRFRRCPCAYPRRGRRPSP